MLHKYYFYDIFDEFHYWYFKIDDHKLDFIEF